MWTLFASAVVLYAAASVVVFTYAVSQLHLVWFSSGTRPPLPQPLDGDDLPEVTVQLPLRNERRVVRSLLRTIAALDWPRDRLFVQVLDDSDDETVALCAEECRRLRASGLRIEHVRRSHNTGFKAGALAHGLKEIDSAFVALFDADFRPKPDFLRRAMAVLLSRPELGLVQARWGHINREESWFTRAQAFHLDAHFSVEQLARSREPLLMGFNGTAGVWRRACIDAAGGWSADSLTEDLDLSFRAQLAGWPLTYVDSLEAPAEVPVEVRAIRSQQHRWMKGGAQVARKLLGRLWRSERPLIAKLQGTLHLGGGSVFLAVLALVVVTPVLYPATQTFPSLSALLDPATLLLQSSLVVLVGFYGTMCWRRDGGWNGVKRLVLTFFPFLSLSTGLALHNALAVAEGWLGIESPFVRTPKRGVAGDGGELYAARSAGWIVWAELALSVWATAGMGWAILHGQWILGLFLATQAVGAGAVAVGSLVPSTPISPALTAPQPRPDPKRTPR